MIFPKKYKCLPENNFTQGEYAIVPIRFEDRVDIMKWRNEQIYHLRQTELLTEEKQDYYFKNVISTLFNQEKPNQILFSYLKNNKFIGYGGLVHINWVDKNAEISFIMNTSLEKEYFNFHWITFLKLLEQVSFNTLNFHKIFTYAFDIRPQLYIALEDSGFNNEAVLKEHCLFNNKFYDVKIHTKINKDLRLRKIEKKDVKLMFDLATDPITRENSFESNEILYQEHVVWFTRKLLDKNANYYICLFKSEEVGLIRFDRDVKSNETTIGITINKLFRGKGLAAKFLELACKKNSSKIKAFIKPANIASIKTFKKAGFVFKEELVINQTKAFVFYYERR